MHIGRFSRCGAFAAFILGLSSAQQVTAQDSAEMAFLNAPVVFQCADNSRSVDPTGYFIALHYGTQISIVDDAQAAPEPGYPFAISARIVVHVASKTGFFPLMLLSEGTERVYKLNCAAQPTPADSFPSLFIRVSTGDEKAELISLLERRAGEATSKGSPAPLLFSGSQPEAAAIPLPTQPSRYGALVSGYLASRPDVAFLDLFTGSYILQSGEPGNSSKVINLKHLGPRRAPEADNSSAKPPPASSSAPDETPKPGRTRNIQIKLANKALLDINLATPGMVDTLGYCARVTQDEKTTGVYILVDCVTDDKQQLSIRVAGFEPLTIQAGNAPIGLDSALAVRTYQVAYPARWLGAASDRVEVQGGPIGDVLKRRIGLRQWGLNACETGTNVKLADILGATLTFPDPPCRTIELQVPREMFGKVPPAIVEGCWPGNATPVEATADGRIRCIITAPEAKAGGKKVKLAWAAGFDPINLDLPTSKGPTAALRQPDLANFLRPSLARQDGVPPDASAPLYRPFEVRYRIRTQACGKAALPLKAGVLPSVAEAGCNGLPDGMDLTFEVDREKTNPSVPLQAFQDKMVQTVALGSPQSIAGMRLDGRNAALKLPIDFNPDRKQRYATQYSQAAELLVAGAKIFAASDCSDRSGPPKVALFAKSDKSSDSSWPVFGQVFDNGGRALTDCAKSLVEQGPDNRPYLTFEFKSTRAAGPRRAIVVARSQDLMDKRGLPKALESAFLSFARTANEWHKRGAALSPVDVLSVSQDGTIRLVFTGEDAALQPQTVEPNLAAMDRTAPKTPDLSLLRLQPETKNAERVVIVMDGSSATSRQVSELRLLASDVSVRKGGSLQFMLSSDSCALWQPHAPQLRCVNVESLPPAEREKTLADAFTGLLNLPRAK